MVFPGTSGHIEKILLSCGVTVASATRRRKFNKQFKIDAERLVLESRPCYPLFENDPNLRNLRGDAAYSALMGKLKQQWLYYKATL